MDLHRAMSPAETTEPAAPTATAGAPFRSGAFSIAPPLLIVGAILAVYAHSLSGPFVLDDITSIRDSPSIRHLWPIGNALWPPSGQGLTTNGRPLVNLSFALNYAAGGLRVRGYHAVNLGIHLLAALTLYGVARRTLQKIPMAAATALAFSIALLWGVHPLATEAVTYVAQRAESLMALCYLLTMYGFIRATDREPVSRVWSAFTVLTCLLGMASKEVMVSAPLLAVLYDRTFVSGSFRAAWARHRGLFLGLAATWPLLAYEVCITGSRGGTAGYGSHVLWWRYALTQLPAIWHYLRLCYWPHPLIFDYGIGLAWQPLRVLPAAIGVLALLSSVAIATVRRPALGFLGAAFFAILAPSSSVIPIATETMSEHRMYLPLAVVIALTVVVLYRGAGAIFAGRPGPSIAGLLVGTGLAAAALGRLTQVRNRDYRSNLAIWTATTESYPKNMRALYNRGVAWTELGRTADAVKDYERVVRIQPDYGDAHQNLANGLVKLGRVEESIPHYEVAVNASPASGELQCSLGIALLDTDRVEQAIRHFQKALELKPGMAEATDQLGEALLRDNRPGEAVPLLEAAERARPQSAEVRNALGNALLQLGRSAAAADAYREAIRLKAAFPEAHNNLGNFLLQSGEPVAAAAEFRAAIEAKADFGEAHNNLGDALLETGSPELALREFAEAVRLQPNSADAHYNWANSLAKIGQLDHATAQYREVLRLRPDFAEAHNNLGIALVRLDRWPEARAEFVTALRLRPDYPDARANLAKVTELLRSPP
jgi:tetratricopeptide (TPR) repeat protein